MTSGWKLEIKPRFKDTILHEQMRAAAVHMGMNFIKEGDSVVDLGADADTLLFPFIEKFGDSCQYQGFANGPELAAQTRDKFSDFPNVVITEHDLSFGLPNPDKKTNLFLCDYAFYKLPVTYRHHLLHQVFKSLDKDGAIVIIEPIFGSDSAVETVLRTLTEQENDEQDEKITEVTVPADWTSEWLRRAGFKHVECFWRTYGAGVWVAFK